MNLENPRILWLKGLLFTATGILSLALVWLECFTWRVAAFSLLACWCFARAYYFAFYVIGHYIDPSYRFAGVWSAWRYWRRHGCSAVPPGTAPALPRDPPDEDDGHDKGTP